MDALKAVNIKDRLAAIPRISQTPSWVAAPPSHRLHLLLGASWMGFLYTVGLFASTSSEESPVVTLGLVDSFALAMFLVTLLGILAVVGLAIANHRWTAPVSVISGLSVIAVGATCGFVGHPVSAWGPDAALATGIVAGSVAIMSRRQRA